jgi:hypothetical protein
LVENIKTRAGSEDVYNSDLGWLRNNTPQAALTDGELVFSHDLAFAGGLHFGFLPKNSDGVRAYYHEGAFIFVNSRGAEQHMSQGGYMIKLASKTADGSPDVYASQPADFQGSYVLINGKAITEPTQVEPWQG